MEIGIYHTAVSDWPTVKNLGIRLVQVYPPTTENLNIAQVMRLSVFVELKHITEHDVFQHPSVRYWMLEDEPDMWNVPPKTVRDQHQQVKYTDPLRRPTLCMVSALWHNHLPWYRRWPGFNYLAYKDSGDIIGTDKYGSPGSVKSHIRFNFKPVIGKRPWFAAVDLRRSPEDIFDTCVLLRDMGCKLVLLYAYRDEGSNFYLWDHRHRMIAIEKAVAECQ